MSRRQFLQVSALTGAVVALPKMVNAAPARKALKCVAGWPGWDRCQQVGASFGYQWDNADPEHGKIPNLKGEDEFTSPWTGEAAIRTAARSGSVMVGNEWSLKGWSPDKQADLLHYFFDIALDENPNVYVLGPNDIAWCPQTGWLGFHNIEQVANRYVSRYGELPPFKGIGFHAYHWPGGANLTNVIYWTAIEARRIYGNIDMQITETGSLVGEQAALDSMPMIQDGLNVGITAWFWYVSHGPDASRIWDNNWNITRVGRAFRDF